jgi:hypothetical protein
MKSVFNSADLNDIKERIGKLNAESKPLWGIMKSASMLAHCSVTYEMIYTDKHPKPNFLLRFILTRFVKKNVVGPKPYTHNSRTAPAFVISGERNFEQEKEQLFRWLERVYADGKESFDGRESHSFGKLTASEWDVMMYKHLDHHLKQFGV